MSSPSQHNTGEEELSDLDIEILAMFSPEQPNTREEDDSNIDSEILAMLEEANQAFKEGLEEQEACNRELQEDLDFDATLDREFEQAFGILDEEDPGWDDPTWSDRSGAVSVASVRSYGLGSLPDEYRNNDDDARSEVSDLSLFRKKIPPVGSRPILKPKTSVRATPAEKAASAMIPFTVSNPANIPAMSFPSNPTWGGAPIPSSGQQTLTFMGATTSVPVLSDTTNMELVNNMGVTNTTSSDSKDKELVGMAMKELNTAKHEIAAAGVHRAALEADIRRLEEDRKDMGLRVADLEKRLIEKLDSGTEVQKAVMKELHICRNALTASQQSCNTMNKENGDLRRKISDLANAMGNLDKEGNEIRHRVSELTNNIAFVHGELDSRTRERDFAVQKLGEAQVTIDQAVAANNHCLQQIATMESNAAAKDLELKNLQSIAEAKDREVQNLTSITEAKEREVQNLAGIAEAKEIEFKNLTSIAEAKDREVKDLQSIAEAKELELKNLASIAEAKELELKNLMTALTKSETEKRDLKLKSKEKGDIIEGDGGEPEKTLSKTEQSWKDKYCAAEKNLVVAERHAEAYEQDYYDIKKQYDITYTTVSQLTDTIAKMKVVSQQKEAMISELTMKGTELSKDLEELKFSTGTERANHYDEMDKLKERYRSIKGEKEYIDGLLSNVNLECTSLNGLAARNKRKIQELEDALENETATIASLQEQVKKERNSSDDALHISRIAALHRAQRTHGFPRPRRDNGRFQIPTLDEQLAAWREDDGSSARFMEDHRRALKENPLTPYKPIKKPTSVEGSEDSPTPSHKKTPSVPTVSSVTEVDLHEKTASDFDDTSITAVEPSVYSNETISEPGDVSDTENEPRRSSNDYLSIPTYLAPIDAYEPGHEVKYVEKVVYVDKEIIVNKIVEHTIHQARSPIWAFLYVYVDLWMIFAHRNPDFVESIAQFYTANITDSLFSTVVSKTSDHTRIDTIFSKLASTGLTNINIRSKTKEPTVTDIESQTGDLTKVISEPDTGAKVTHKLPPLWPNLITALLHLLTIYIVYKSFIILSQRHIWLSANKVTRSAVARFWGREAGSFYIAMGPSNWYVFNRVCFWVIQDTGYSYALPG